MEPNDSTDQDKTGAVPDKQSADIGTDAPSTEEKSAEPKRGANGQFLKGSPPPKGVGRKKGSPNRFNRTIKETFEAVFKDLQKSSKTNLMAWAVEHPGDFYKLANRLVEKSLRADVNVQHQNVIDEMTLVETAHRMAYILTTASEIVERDSPAPVDALALPAPVATVERARPLHDPDPIDPPPALRRVKPEPEVWVDDRKIEIEASSIEDGFARRNAPFRWRR